MKKLLFHIVFAAAAMGLYTKVSAQVKNLQAHEAAPFSGNNSGLAAMAWPTGATSPIIPMTTPVLVNNNITIDLSLYPNPNSGSFEFATKVNSFIDEYVYYGVYDVAGRLLYQGSGYTRDRLAGGEISLGASAAPGQYILLVSAQNAKNAIHFEIKQ